MMTLRPLQQESIPSMRRPLPSKLA